MPSRTSDDPQPISDLAGNLLSKAKDSRSKAEPKSESFDFKHDTLPAHVIEIVSEQMGLEQEALDREGKHISYMARGMVNASMPYKDPKTDSFKRVNGDFTLRIVGGDEGVPFGIYPRLLMLWLTTEVVHHGRQEIQLGDSLSDFLRTALGVTRITGGTRGTGTLVVNQMKRLFGSMVSMKYENKKGQGRKNFAINNVMVAEKLRLEDTSGDYLWVPQSTADEQGWESMVMLTKQFFDEIRDGPVPVKPEHYRNLRDSPLAMDLYAWLGYRMSYLKTLVHPIRWESLQVQFGSGYPADKQGVRNFRKNFLTALRMVEREYEDLHIETDKRGLILKPSPTPVSRVYYQSSLPFETDSGKRRW